MRYEGKTYALHDYFLVKSLDGLKPGGVMALVTSHYRDYSKDTGLL